MDESKLLKKYNIVYIHGLRFYKIDLSTVRTTWFENTTPYCLVVNQEVFHEHAWGSLIIRVLELIDTLHPKTIGELLSIENDWSKQAVFDTQEKSNYSPYRGIFINVNHNATHSVWTLQLLLNEYGIDLESCEFIIRRQPSVEPPEVIAYYKDKRINAFTNYLRKDLTITERSIDNIFSTLEKINQRVLPKLSKGYADVFLIEDPTIFLNYRKSILDFLEKMGNSQKTLQSVDYKLGILCNYVKIQYAENEMNYDSYIIGDDGKDSIDDFFDDFNSFDE